MTYCISETQLGIVKNTYGLTCNDWRGYSSLIICFFLTCYVWRARNKSHAGTVVPDFLKDDNAIRRKSGKFDPRSLRNPWTDRHLNWNGSLSRELLPYAKCHHDTITPIHPQMRKNAHQVTRLLFGVLPSACKQDACKYVQDQYVKWRVFAQECAFWWSRKHNFTFTLHFPIRTQFYGKLSTAFTTFNVEETLTMAMLTCKVPLSDLGSSDWSDRCMCVCVRYGNRDTGLRIVMIMY